MALTHKLQVRQPQLTAHSSASYFPFFFPFPSIFVMIFFALDRVSSFFALLSCFANSPWGSAFFTISAHTNMSFSSSCSTAFLNSDV